MGTPTQRSILVVDDSEGVRAAVSMLLEDHGITAFTASNQQEALNAIQHAEYDLVLVDVQLGVESGLTLATEVLVQRPKTKIILMSGADVPVHSHPELPVLQKPFARAELLECIQKVLELAA